MVKQSRRPSTWASVKGFTVWFLAVTCMVAQADDPPATQTKDGPPPLLLDDAAVIPSDQVSESEYDRRQALAYYAVGIAEKNRRDFDGSLKAFERAHRYDPASMKILEEIMLLTEGLRRPAERARYGLRAVEAGLDDPLLMQRLAAQFVQSKEFDKAQKLYAKLVEQEQENSKNSFRLVLLKMELAKALHQGGKHTEAADTFEFVLNALDSPDEFEIDKEQRSVLLGDADQTYAQMGEAFLKAGRPEKAETAFNAAFADSQDEAALAWQLAQVHAAAGRDDRVMEELGKYFESKSHDYGLPPYELLAATLEKLSKKDEIITRLESLRRDAPKDLFIAFALAQRHQSEDRLDQAAELLEVVANQSEASMDFSTLVAPARQKLAAIYRHQPDGGKLLNVLSAAVASEGDLASVGDEVDLIIKDEKLLDAILSAAKESVRQDDAKARHQTALAAGMLAQAAKRYEVADEFFEVAVKADADEAGQTLLTWGLGLLMDDQNERAAKVFQRGIDEELLEDRDPRFHFFLCHAWELLGRTDEALKVAREAAAMNEANPRIEGREAWVLFHAGRHEEARRRYVELIDKYDLFHVGGNGAPLDDLRETVREWRLALSNICVLEGKFEEGEEWVQQVLDENPDDPTGLNDLGYLWADQNKRLTRATAMIEQAVQAEPKNHAFRDSLGWAYYRSGRFADAIKELEMAADEESPDGVILDHLADAYFAAGEKDKALAAWKRALEAFDKKREADKIKATQEKIERNSK